MMCDRPSIITFIDFFREVCRMRVFLLPCYNIFWAPEYPAHQDVRRGTPPFNICEGTVPPCRGLVRDSPVKKFADVDPL